LFRGKKLGIVSLAMDSPNPWDEIINRYKLPLAAGVVGFVLLVGGTLSSGVITKTFLKSTQTPSTTDLSKSTLGVSAFTIKVDVSGSVVNPGVYTLSKDSRVEDAIKAAGGVTEEISQEYLSKNINLAQKVSDGIKIYIPKEGEQTTSSANSSAPSDQTEVGGLININTASLQELDKLPGVGEVTAQKIIDGRPYSGIEDLFTKKAVSRAVYEKIKEKVTTY
jgi:competence protein ComEA